MQVSADQPKLRKSEPIIRAYYGSLRHTDFVQYYNNKLLVHHANVKTVEFKLYQSLYWPDC